jgi:hypothetical protein
MNPPVIASNTDFVASAIGDDAHRCQDEQSGARLRALSSNRTCRKFPASGSRRRLHGFAHESPCSHSGLVAAIPARGDAHGARSDNLRDLGGAAGFAVEYAPLTVRRPDASLRHETLTRGGLRGTSGGRKEQSQHWRGFPGEICLPSTPPRLTRTRKRGANASSPFFAARWRLFRVVPQLSVKRRETSRPGKVPAQSCTT